MSLTELRAIVVDLDTALLTGLTTTYETLVKLFPKRRPSLWIWVPESFQGFYSNKSLKNTHGVDYFVCGKLDIGDFQPHQVLLWSRSVDTLLPIRKGKVCQTVIGDSLGDLLEGSLKKRFSAKYVVEFSEGQRIHLSEKRQSKIYEYLKTYCAIEELNMSLWIQERCEGIAICAKQSHCKLVV